MMNESTPSNNGGVVTGASYGSNLTANETTPSNNGGVVARTSYGSNLTVNSSLPVSAKDPEYGNATPSKATSESNVDPTSPKAIIKDALQISG